MMDRMRDSRDIVDIDGLPKPPPGDDGEAPSRGEKASGGKFLSVWYRCCHTYGRMTRNAARTEYVGRCPKCGTSVRAKIGDGGTSRRVFEAG